MFREVSTELNSVGVSLNILYTGLEVDVTEDTVKELFKAIIKTKWGLQSTTELSTKQLQEAFEEFNRHLAKFGVHIPFPSVENTDEAIQSYQQMQ